MGVIIGVVGLDRIGSFHADTLSRLNNVDGLVVTDGSPAVTAAAAARFDAEAATDATGVLAADVDGLVIGAATPEHTAVIVAAAEAGIPVFCERPVASSAIDSDEFARWLARSSVPVRIGFDRPLDPTFAAARTAVAAGQPGWLHTVQSTILDPAPSHHVSASGGIVRDCAIHDFDVVLWVVGAEAVEVYVTGSNRDEGRLEGRRSAGLERSAPVRGPEPGPGFPDDRARTYLVDRFTAAYRSELVSFVDVIAGSIPSPYTAADVLEAAWTAETLCAHEAFSLQQRPIEMSEVRR
jgi:myo-inositol 2-dehydrogenase/D-chiro-inositol 1-dehydrogenase